MLSQSTIVRTAPQQDLINELRVFVKGALKIERGNPLDLTKAALRLLKNLPAARNALFEHFSNIFAEAALNYIHAIETEIQTGEASIETDESVVSEIHSVLISFIADNPTAWAPIISAWSLELLGEVSTRFAGRARTSTKLNESLQLWMNCRATKILVDINTKCLSSLMHSDTETCINALLDTSVKHSPNFDWVVAHVGSCFPTTVITRVLSCGLKDFCQIKSYEQGSNSPKLRSVVGILGHLAGSHSNDIKASIWEMFFWSLQHDPQDTDVVRLQKKATVPFILQLAFLSTTLFSSICKEMKNSLRIEVIEKLYVFIEDWCKYFGSNEILEDILVTLILCCDNGGIYIINLLLDCTLFELGTNEIRQAIREKSLELLCNVLHRFDDNVRWKKKTELLSSLTTEIGLLQENLLSEHTVRLETSVELIVLLSHDNPSLLVNSATYLFQNAKNVEQLGLLIKILNHELIDNTIWPYADKGGYFSVVLERMLSRHVQKFCTSNEENTDLTFMWNNLVTLLKWEKSGRVSSLNSKLVSKAIQWNLIQITSLFNSEIVHVHVIAEILDQMELSARNNLEDLPAEVVLNLSQSIVNYFFICCREEGTLLQIKGLERVNRLLRRLCTQSKAAKVVVLRELLERSLFRNDNVLFGSKNNAINDENDSKLLLKQNKKINKTIPLTKHSSVFNGGIIGTGKRKLQPGNELRVEIIALNTSELISVIKSCCCLPEETDNRFSDVSLESVTSLSLLLVQFVSPDVMYNGLPWPDEEFSKVTIERDLFIRRLFGNSPVLWDLLSFIAVHRPALCYCSVLFRALTATLIHQWKSTGEQTRNQVSTDLMTTTIKVIDVMAMGQLLPPPLCHIRDVLPKLKSFEIVAVLKDCIWCYMRDHIPSPALFTCDSNGIHWRDPTISKPAQVYTNTLRIIMQRNIETLGHLYAQMFINVPGNE